MSHVSWGEEVMSMVTLSPAYILDAIFLFRKSLSKRVTFLDLGLLLLYCVVFVFSILFSSIYITGRIFKGVFDSYTDLIGFLFTGLFMSIFCASAIISWKGSRTLLPTAPPRDYSFSILIPAHNEEKTIESCINSILGQTYKPSQVIVINDGSTDTTASILEKFGDRITVVKNPTSIGKTKSLESCIPKLGCNLSLVVDADTVLRQDFLDNVRRDFDTDKVGAVSGTVFSFVNGKQSFFQRFLHAARFNEYLFYQHFRKTGQSNRQAIYTAAGCCFVVRTSILKEIGFPKGTEVEDMDLTWTLQERGILVKYSRDAVAYTEEPRSTKELLRQLARWYRGGWQCFFVHGLRPWKTRKRLLTSTWLLQLEGLPFSVFFLSIPLIALIDIRWAISFFLIDLLSLSILFYYAKTMHKFLDSVMNIPAYYLLKQLNAIAFLYGFGTTLIAWSRGRRNWSH